MIDIHSHILQAVDDGSISIEQSLEILKEEEIQGVTDVILTPHYRADYLTDREVIENNFAELKEAVKNRGINVNLYLGQEIYIFSDLVNALKDGKLLSMNGTKYVLVEFSMKHPMDVAETVYMLIRNGYIPIVAHIGRYFYVDIDTAREVKELGGLIQINASSLCRSFRFKRKAMNLIKHGLVDFVASDVHAARKNDMKKAYQMISKKFGAETADKLFTETAKKIIEK